MDVRKAIRQAQGVLPGVPAPDGETDPRWQAIIAVGEYADAEPEAVWSFIQTWGGHEQEDLRDAVATCLLEHLLEHHFDDYFARVEARARGDPLFADTVVRCWKFGQAEEADNAARFDGLLRRLPTDRGE